METIGNEREFFLNICYTLYFYSDIFTRGTGHDRNRKQQDGGEGTHRPSCCQLVGHWIVVWAKPGFKLPVHFLRLVFSELRTIAFFCRLNGVSIRPWIGCDVFGINKFLQRNLGVLLDISRQMNHRKPAVSGGSRG